MVQVVPPLDGEESIAPASNTATTIAAVPALSTSVLLPDAKAAAAERIDQLAADAVALVSDPPRTPTIVPPPLPEAAHFAPVEGMVQSTGLSTAWWTTIAGGLVAAAIVAAGIGWYVYSAESTSEVADANANPATAKAAPPMGTFEDAVTRDSNALSAPGSVEPEVEKENANQTLEQALDPAERLPPDPPIENVTSPPLAPPDVALPSQTAASPQNLNAEEQPRSEESADNQAVSTVEPAPLTPDGHVTRKPSLVLEDLPDTLLHSTAPSPVLTPGASPADEADDSAEQADPAQAQPDNPPVAAERPLRRIAPDKVDVPARLAITIAAVEFREAPLYKALATISDLAGVTISLDVDALYAAGIGIDEPVNVKGASLSIGQILEQALRPVGLTGREVQGQLVVAPINAQQSRKARYAVEDLVRAGDPSVEELTDVVRAHIAQGKSSRNEMELGVVDGAIVLSATEIEHDRMIELCEKLRVARGRPLRSRFSPDRPDHRFDPGRFELATRRARAQSILGRPITAGIGRAAPLCDVVAYLAEQSGATLLVDGVALAEAGLAVETEARLTAAGETLEVALTRLLEPLKLVYRVVDDSVIEITTPKAVNERPCFEFYSVRGLLTGPAPSAEQVQSIREKIIATAGIESPAVAWFFDLPSQCFIVSAPYPDQVRLAQALQTLDRP
jgi:hypothetical protein